MSTSRCRISTAAVALATALSLSACAEQFAGFSGGGSKPSATPAIVYEEIKPATPAAKPVKPVKPAKQQTNKAAPAKGNKAKAAADNQAPAAGKSATATAATASAPPVTKAQSAAPAQPAIDDGMTLDDRKYQRDATRSALAYSVDQTISWNNPVSGNDGRVTVIGESVNDAGKPCKDLRAEAHIGGQILVTGSTWCKTGSKAARAMTGWEIAQQPAAAASAPAPAVPPAATAPSTAASSSDADLFSRPQQTVK